MPHFDFLGLAAGVQFWRWWWGAGGGGGGGVRVIFRVRRPFQTAADATNNTNPYISVRESSYAALSFGGVVKALSAAVSCHGALSLRSSRISR